MFFKIGVLKNFTIFTGKHLRWSYFLIKLQARRSAILLQRDFNKGTLLFILSIFLITLFFEEHLRTTASVLLIIKLVISIDDLLAFS